MTRVPIVAVPPVAASTIAAAPAPQRASNPVPGPGRQRVGHDDERDARRTRGDRVGRGGRAPPCPRAPIRRASAPPDRGRAAERGREEGAGSALPRTAGGSCPRRWRRRARPRPRPRRARRLPRPRRASACLRRARRRPTVPRPPATPRGADVAAASRRRGAAAPTPSSRIVISAPVGRVAGYADPLWRRSRVAQAEVCKTLHTGSIPAAASKCAIKNGAATRRRSDRLPAG